MQIKQSARGRGVYLFMAVSACIKATAFSMGGIGGLRLRFCLSVYQIEAFYTYMFDLQCGRLNYSRGGSALGSIGLVWGGNNSFGRALLPILYIVQVCYPSSITSKG